MLAVMEDLPKSMPDHNKLQGGREELRAWYGHGLGMLLLDIERGHLDEVLHDLFGYHLLQVGCFHGQDLLAASRISHRVVLDADIARQNVPSSPVCGCADELPIATDSVDVVVLPHTLEFEPDPHRVLREVERVLIAEGHVVVLAFNPWSLWGVWRWVLARRGIPPWSGRFLGLIRIKDWLALLGFDVVLVRQYFFRPPLQRDGVMRRLMFMEKIGARLWPRLSGAYMVVARKRVTTLTPIKPRWRPRRSLVGVPARPCARTCSRSR